MKPVSDLWENKSYEEGTGGNLQESHQEGNGYHTCNPSTWEAMI